jgi:hypothetical protein
VVSFSGVVMASSSSVTRPGAWVDLAGDVGPRSTKTRHISSGAAVLPVIALFALV